MATDAQRRAAAKWTAENVRHITLKVYPKDADLLEWLDSKESRNGYIMRLIREDMDRTLKA